MKKLIILLTLLTGLSQYQPGYAQVNVSVNIGNQPIWGPTGYDYVEYYYLPDLDIYYYVPLQQWIYFSGNRWITAATLPPQYRNYDLYGMHKVVINEKQPYLRNTTYRKQYAQFKGRNDQKPIRDSRESKYFVINDHPQHGKAVAAKPGGQPNRNTNQPGNQSNQPGNQPNRAGNQPGRGAAGAQQGHATNQPQGRGPH